MDNPFYCQDLDRRRRVRNQSSDVNGIEAVRVLSSDPHVLEVRLFRDWPEHALTSPHKPLSEDNIRIEGGRRPPQAQSTANFSNDGDGGGLFRVTLACPGDKATTYTLRLIDPNNPSQPPAHFDPQFAHASFTFDRREILDEDPQANRCPPDAPPPAPPIDYLAKDYASFRRLMLDRLSQTIPGWTERRTPDLGVTLVEVLAYVADHLSYYQDAAATEAYLATARKRTSVRRHVRLVDYSMHEGCNARTWVCVRVNADAPAVRLADLTFCTSPDPLALTSQGRSVPNKDVLANPDAGFVVFESIRSDDAETRDFYSDHNEIDFYTWGDGDCCLPRGATAATLVAPNPLPKIGAVLLFEEVLGPMTGQPADADAHHRWFVRLTGVEPGTDSVPPTGPVQLVNVTWDARDALPFSLCISAGRNHRISVARGNVLLVDHGLTLPDFLLTLPAAPADAPPRRARTRVRLATALEHAPEGTAVALPLPQPVTWAAPYPDPDAVAGLQARRLALQRAGAGFTAFVVDPTRALSLPKTLRKEIAAVEQQIDERVQHIIDDALAGQPMSAGAEAEIDTLLAGIAAALTKGGFAAPPIVPTLGNAFEFIGPAADALTNNPLKAVPVVVLNAGESDSWTPQQDLLASGPDDRHFVVEVEEEGEVWLRFGDGVEGRAPQPGEVFIVRCRLGNGAAGNVGAESLTTLLLPSGDPDWLIGIRNPLPAVGGIAPEPLERVRTFAPTAFRSDLRRAICAEDYATLTEKDDRVQRAAARLIWAGTHYEVRVAVDLLAEAFAPGLDTDVQQQVIFGQIEAVLNRYRRMGHELNIVAPNWVPLVLRLGVCVAPHAERGRVKAAVGAALGAHVFAGGKRGFFHPDNLTFGQVIDASALVALVQALPGVTSVAVLEFRRLTAAPGGAPAELAVGPLEIPQLDADPGRPERGQLFLKLEGGR